MLKKWLFACKDRHRYNRERTVSIFEFDPGFGFNLPVSTLPMVRALQEEALLVVVTLTE